MTHPMTHDSTVIVLAERVIKSERTPEVSTPEVSDTPARIHDAPFDAPTRILTQGGARTRGV